MVVRDAMDVTEGSDQVEAGRRNWREACEALQGDGRTAGENASG